MKTRKIKIKKVRIPARDGFLLSAMLHIPNTPSKGFVQINGGTGLPKELYEKFACFLTEFGFTTLTFDCRGIGESKPQSLRGFKAKIPDWGYQDLTGILDWVVANYPNDKIILIGHSMGGQMVGLMENNYLIDQLILISSGTGYWLDLNNIYKWIISPLWFTILPFSIFICGYAPAKFFGQGENLPKGIALDWIKWSRQSKYFEVDFGSDIPKIYFDQVSIPLTSIQIDDDPIANATTSAKLLQYFSKAVINVEHVSPLRVGRKKIGHVGYFSQKSKPTLWPSLLNLIS